MKEQQKQVSMILSKFLINKPKWSDFKKSVIKFEIKNGEDLRWKFLVENFELKILGEFKLNNLFLFLWKNS